jgi:hypothetical protein
MRRKRGWEREREGEGGRENLRLDGVSPALSLTSQSSQLKNDDVHLVAAERSECCAKSFAFFCGEHPSFHSASLRSVPYASITNRPTENSVTLDRSRKPEGYPSSLPLRCSAPAVNTICVGSFTAENAEVRGGKHPLWPASSGPRQRLCRPSH